MNLAARKTARLRDDFVMRFGAVMIAVALLVGTLYQPPKAKAFAATATVVTVAACFLASCGITWLVQGADETGFNDAVGGPLQDYLDTEFAGQTVTEWAGDFTGIAMSGSKLLLPKLIAQKLGAFAGWVVNKYSLTAGGSNATVKAGKLGLRCADGSIFNFGIFDYSAYKWDGYGTCLEPGTNLVLESGAKFLWFGKTLKFYLANGTQYPNAYSSYTFDDQTATNGRHKRAVIAYEVSANTFWVCDQYVNTDGTVNSDADFNWSGMQRLELSLLGSAVNAGEIAVSPSAALDISKPGTMADDESIAIDTAITAGTLAELLERINAALRANELSTTQEVVKEQAMPGEITDVNDLGLPSLSAIITTRFPFSIPWDVVKGLKLLAAPAKTPHWEVDFYGAVSGMVPGGWKGDTSIVVDFMEFEVLGQLCRWTSTIGFCLFLAMGTKKLIWVS